MNLLFVLFLISKPSFGASETVSSTKIFNFTSSFSVVWAAAQNILGSYPLETNDKSEGLMRTRILKSGEFWQAPFEKPLSDNYSQRLTFIFSKTSAQTTQLEIKKEGRLKTDFLGSEQDFNVPAWEELRVVYKLKREIEINNILKKIK